MGKKVKVKQNKKIRAILLFAYPTLDPGDAPGTHLFVHLVAGYWADSAINVVFVRQPQIDSQN